MNILHHKSWHVRNKRNIERVRRDERNALQNELQIQNRILLAEQEKRTQLLRDRAQTSTSAQSVTTTVVEGSQHSQHINIFDDFEDKITTTNSDHQKEVKEEKEKWETNNGILTYLHNKDNKDSDLDNNWYLESHEIRMKLIDAKSEDNNSSATHLKDMNLKKRNDPLEDMKRYLDLMRPKTDVKTDKKKVRKIEFVRSGDSKHDSRQDSTQDSTQTTQSTHKSKKSKKHKKKKRKRHSSDSSDHSKKVSNKSVSKSLEQLRAERLQREKVERERTRALLSARFEPKSDSVIIDDRQRAYNCQFNPHIARQNKCDS